MISNIGWRIPIYVDLSDPHPKVHTPNTLAIQGDSAAHIINIHVTDNRKKADLSSVKSVKGYFRLGNGYTGSCQGIVMDNVIQLFPTSLFYAYPGEVRLLVRIETATAKMTIAELYFYVSNFISTVSQPSNPEDVPVIPDIPVVPDDPVIPDEPDEDDPITLGIVSQPTNANGYYGGDSWFVVFANGTNLKYTWQRAPKTSSNNWSDITAGDGYSFSSNSEALVIAPINSSHFNYYYRCRVQSRNSDGVVQETIYTNPVELILVSGGAEIVTQPQNAENKSVGSTITFSVTALGTDLTYTWKKKTSGSSSWVTANEGTNGLSTYTFTADSNTFTNEYKCVVSGSKMSVDSNIVTVSKKPSITVKNHEFVQGGIIDIRDGNVNTSSYFSGWSYTEQYYPIPTGATQIGIDVIIAPNPREAYMRYPGLVFYNADKQPLLSYVKPLVDGSSTEDYTEFSHEYYVIPSGAKYYRTCYYTSVVKWFGSVNWLYS